MSGKRLGISEYVQYRCKLRGFPIDTIEEILRFSSERYYDTETHRNIAVGSYGKVLLLIPYEEADEMIQPVTVHAITRQQIRFRLQTGRFV